MFLITSIENDDSAFENAFKTAKLHIKRRSPANRSQAALAGAETAAKLVEAEMRVPKTGRIYNLPWMPNQASRAGEMPAVQTKALIESFETNIIGEGTAEWATDHDHAIWMEFGWHDPSGAFHQRPFMRPGVMKYRSAIHAAMKEAMK